MTRFFVGAALALIASLACGQTEIVPPSSGGVTADSSGNVTAVGQFIGKAGSIPSPAFSFTGFTNYGIYAGAGPNRLGFVVNGNEYAILRGDSGFINVRGTFGYSWSPASDALATADTGLERDAAGRVAITDGQGNKAYRDLKVRHFIGGSTAPTIANGAGAGTSPGTPTTAGSDAAGQITIVTGTLPSISAVAVTVTFNAAYGAAPYVVIWPANANAATLGFLPYVGSTTTTFTVNNGTVALGASTTYVYNYVVVQ
jgi:hypothetical protein